jgi:hypothetical protein
LQFSGSELLGLLDGQTPALNLSAE